MKFILTVSIERKEFLPLQRKFSLEAIKIAAKKSLEGLGKTIKSLRKIPQACLKKIYLTSPGGAGRAIFLLEISNKKSVLVILRAKNEKKIGANMTIKNPRFKQLLEKNLNLILHDIGNKNYEEYEL